MAQRHEVFGDRFLTVPLLVAASVAMFLAREIIAGLAGLSDDEAYYRLWSMAPALSFYDHPPMVAWLMAAGQLLAGDTVLGQRILAPVMLAAGAFLHWRSTKILTNGHTALIASWMFLAMPLLAVGGIIMTPDLPSVFFYGLVLYGLAELDRSQKANWWLAIGLFAGCGLLSKYTNLFAGITILLWVLIVPRNRRWLACPQFWLGGLIAVLVFCPVLIWNWQHDGASFAKQFARAGRGQEFGVRYPLEMIGSLLGLASPIICALSSIGLIDVMRRAWVTRDSRLVLLAAAGLPMLLYFCLHSLHDRVQANWLAPVYPVLAIYAAIGLTTVAPKLRRATAIGAIGFGIGSTTLIYAHAVAPILQLPKDPAGQLRGWAQFSQKIETLRLINGAQWVATSSYATTGQLSFGLRHTVPVAQLNERIRHIHLPPVSHDLLAGPALYVELERRADKRLLASCFAEFRQTDTIRREDGTAAGAYYSVYIVSRPLVRCAAEMGVLRAAKARL